MNPTGYLVIRYDDDFDEYSAEYCADEVRLFHHLYLQPSIEISFDEAKGRFRGELSRMLNTRCRIVPVTDGLSLDETMAAINEPLRQDYEARAERETDSKERRERRDREDFLRLKEKYGWT